MITIDTNTKLGIFGGVMFFLGSLFGLFIDAIVK